MPPKVAAAAAIGRSSSLRSATKIAPATPPSGSSKAAAKGKEMPHKSSSSKAVASSSSKAVASGGPKAAASGGSKAAASGGSKAAPIVKVATTKTTLRGGGVSKPNAKTAAASRTSGKITANPDAIGSDFSPLNPRNLADSSSSTQVAVVPKVKIPFISKANKEIMYTLLAQKVPAIARFAGRWAQLGDSLSGHSFVYNYQPKTFVEDFIHDVSTVNEAVDRPTDCLVFGTIVELVKLDPEILFRKRANWVHHYCAQTDQEVPPPYDQESAFRSANDDNAERRDNRKKSTVNASSDEESEAESLAEVDNFSALQQQPVLNAETVWGSQAGFTIVPHEQILDLHRRTANEVSAANVNVAKTATITWPKLQTWTQVAWMAFDKKWWNCVVEAVHHGVYQPMISLIDLDIIGDIQIDLEISPMDWFSTSEIDFIRKSHGHWGPKNKEEALELLRTVQCTVYKSNISPETFLGVLSSYNSQFLRVLDLQIAPSVRKWPPPGKPKHGPLTIKSIREVFKDGFAACKDKSPACKHCHSVVKQNQDMPHKSLYIELRVHFQDDAKALARSTMGGGAAAGGRQQFAEDSKFNGGRAQIKQSNGGRGPPDRSNRDDSRDRQRKTPQDKKQFKVVLGKDRCVICGDYSNHYGKGSKNCPIAGTRHAKPKDYKWKDSDKEEKVNIPSREYQELRKDKAALFATNAKNRVDYRANAATSKSEHYYLSSDIAVVDMVDAAAPSFISHDGSCYHGVPPTAEIFIDEVQMGQRFSSSDVSISLEDIGYSERFFGVAKFIPPAASVQHKTQDRTMLCFSREVQSTRRSRKPRTMTIKVDRDSSENLISAIALNHTSDVGKLKILKVKKPTKLCADPRPRVLLECRLNHRDASIMEEWFIVDDSAKVSANTVTVTPAFARQHNLTCPNVSTTLHDNPADSSAVVGRVFFDSGAQMSCIAPHLALRHLCVNTVKLNVKVMQGSHEAGLAQSAIQLQFDLFDNEMVPKRYCEWFLVWDNPYGIILGDSFCDHFTTWKQTLASWSSDQAKARFDIPAAFTTWTSATRTPSDSSASSASDSEEAKSPKRARRDISHMISHHPVTGAPLRHRNADPSFMRMTISTTFLSTASGPQDC